MHGLKRKLVLYSDQMIPGTRDIDKELLNLIGKKRPRIGYIPSAGDPSRTYFKQQQEYYARYHIELDPYFELDLNYEHATLNALLTADAIHLSGGDTFYFLRWLKMRKLLDALRQFVRRGGVLIGVSAGAILMTHDIGTSALCGDARPAGNPDTGSLGLVDFGFVPHLGRFASLDEIKAYSKETKTNLYACIDGGGAVICDDEVRWIGNVVLIKDGQVTMP